MSGSAAELERLQLLEHHVLQGNSSLQAGNVFPGGYLAQGLPSALWALFQPFFVSKVILLKLFNCLEQ